MLNLDTHILVYAMTGQLRSAESDLLLRDRWSVSSIVFWELAKLVERHRIDIDLDDRAVTRVLRRLHVWPIDLEVAKVSTQLDFASDPADELIAATSLVHGVPLLTRDRNIRRSQVVPLAVLGH